jgi:hypothetical protein
MSFHITGEAKFLAFSSFFFFNRNIIEPFDRLCSLSEFLATDAEIRVRFPALPDFLRSSGSGKGSAQPRECN